MTSFSNMKTKYKTIFLSVFFVVACLMMSVLVASHFTSLAYASEESSSSGISAILPNMIEFIPMLIAFIVLWIILAKFGWPMFAAMLDKRENTIREALEKSEQAKVESEEILQEYKKQLEQARAESAEIVANARKNAEAVEAELRAQAEKSAEEIIEKAKQSIEAERKAAVATLQASVADMTVDVAGKLIANDLDDGEHRAIIEKYIREAGSF